MHRSLFSLCVIVVAISMYANGQVWQRLSSVRTTSYFNASSGQGTVYNLLHDSCAGRIYAYAGRRLIVSTDDGATWFADQLPQGESMYNELGFAVDGCTVYSVWKDQIGQVRIARKTHADSAWSMIEPTAALFGTMGVNRGVVLFGPDNQTNQMFVSRDTGRTWKAFGSVSASPYSINPVMQVVDTDRTAFHSGFEWMEYDRIADSIVASPVPDTIRFMANSADQAIAIASRSYNDDRARTSRLFVSLNGRVSWSAVNEIRFENADTVLSPSTGGKQIFETSAVV